jgi:hypothetical protein
MAKKKFSEETQIHGPVNAPTTEKVSAPDEKGLWFVVHRDLERDGVHYFAITHHLMQAGSVPDRVPSMGAKSTRVGDNTVPADKSGMINLAGAPATEIYSLCANGTVRPVKITKKLQRLLEDGKTGAVSSAVQLIPPMRRITNLSQHYQQMTGGELPKNGGVNLTFMNEGLRRMGQRPL